MTWKEKGESVEWSCDDTECSCYEGSILCGNSNGSIAIDLHAILAMVNGKSLLSCSNATYCEFHGNFQSVTLASNLL